MERAIERSAPERAWVVELVTRTLRGLLEEQGAEPSAELGERTPLIGHEAVLTSLGLVSLVVEVEQVLEEEHGLALSLTDERAMSQTRSPFRTVGSLADYVLAVAAEVGA